MISSATVSQSFRRVLMRMILHPIESSSKLLLLSCAIFLLAVLCQFPPSTSMPIFRSGNARSILNLSTANNGMGENPIAISLLNKSLSYWLILAVLCFPSALLRRSSIDRFFPVISALLFAVRRNLSSYDLRSAIIRAFFAIECLSIPYSASHRYTTGRETSFRLAISCAVPFLYCSSIHSRFGIGFMKINITHNCDKCKVNGTRIFLGGA